MTNQELQSILKSAFGDSMVSVDSDDEVHFEATVVTNAFEGLSRVRRQQLVYQALGALITSGEVHALALKTYTCDEWQAKQR